MINDLMHENNLDHKLNFEDLPSISNLVDETFAEADSARSTDVYRPDGTINTAFLLRNARILLAANDTDLAKSIFHTLIEHGEALGAAYAGLGVCFEHDGKLDQAIKSYREAIIYEPSYTSLIALSDLLIRKGDFKDAISTLLRANHLPKIRNNETFNIQKSLGNCYLRLGQVDHAESHYKIAYELRPDSPELNCNIGCLALQRSEFKSALLHFQESLRLNANNSAALTGVGIARFNLNEYGAAEQAFLKAIEIEPSNVIATIELVRASYKTGNYMTAAKALREYTEAHAVSASVFYTLAGLYYHSQKFSDAIEYCDRLLDMRPEHEGAKRIRELSQSKSVDA